MRQLVTSFPRSTLRSGGTVYIEGREILITQGEKETRIPVSDAEMGIASGHWYIRRKRRLLSGNLGFPKMHFINHPEDPAALRVLKDMVEGRRTWEAAAVREHAHAAAPTVNVTVEAPRPPEQWVCEYCQKRNAAERVTCWQCGSGR